MRRLLTMTIGLATLVEPGSDGAASAEPAPPVAARTAKAIPAELAAAPAWIGRRFNTGLASMKHTHETQTLRRLGTQALLTIETLIAKSKEFEIGAWTAQPVKNYLGTVEETPKVVTLKVTNIADSNDTITLSCRRTTIAAANADAVRRSSIPAEKQECGDQGRWQPKATKRISVLRCLPFDEKPMDLDDRSTWNSAPHLAFAPSPGIEWLFVNDDCLQGGGWRQVRADRSIVTQVR